MPKKVGVGNGYEKIEKERSFCLFDCGCIQIFGLKLWKHGGEISGGIRT